MDDAKKVLVVGGAGYVGGTLVDQLRSAGFSPTVYDILAYEDRFLKNVNFVYGDVRDREKLLKLLPYYGIVVWLAAVVGDGACAADPFLSESINEISVKWLVDNYGGRIIFPSTCSVYGVNNDLIDEYTTPNPLSVYAKTKLAAEQYMLDVAGERSLVFRLGTLYGIGDAHSRLRLDLVVNILTKRAVQGETLRVCGGEQWRPLIHVQDVAREMVFGAYNEITGLYNLATQNSTIREIAEEVSAVVPECKVEYTEGKFEDLRNYRVNCDRWKSTASSCGVLLPGWVLRQGILQVAQVIKENRIKNPQDPIYSNEAHIQALYRKWP